MADRAEDEAAEAGRGPALGADRASARPAPGAEGSGWAAAGYTAWRRPRAGQAAGVWDRLHRLVLDELSEAELIDWFSGCIGSALVRAKTGVS